MPKLITPIEKIDAVLTLLKQQTSYKTRDEIESMLIDLSQQISQDDLERILYKMVDDKYIIERIKDRNGSHISPRFIISYNGILFDSYTAKSLRDAVDDEQQRLEIERLKTLDQNSEKNQTRLNSLTRWLVFGSIAIVLWQIFLYFYPVHAHYPYWIWETIPKGKR